jgi:hypothetical protein
MTSAMRATLAPALLALAVLAGCATRPPGVKTAGAVVPLDGTHFLVLGVGVISVDTRGAAPAAQVLRGQVLGLQLSNQPGLTFTLGYADGQTVLVPAEAADDVRLEAGRTTGGPAEVKVYSAKLKPPSTRP